MSDTPEEETGETSETEVDNDSVKIDVYIVTGTKNLRLPESFCEECNLFVNSAKKASDEAGVPVEIEVHSWWTNVHRALRHGGYHPPVMVVGGKKLSQGHDVPSSEEIVSAIRDAAVERSD